MSILDIRTGKKVVDMVLRGLPERVATRYQNDGALCAERLGRWHVTFSDGSESYAWGDDLLFLP